MNVEVGEAVVNVEGRGGRGERGGGGGRGERGGGGGHGGEATAEGDMLSELLCS